ncbi:MAG: LysR substrate-binding domain-containing protein [Thiolinea sp.]
MRFRHYDQLRVFAVVAQHLSISRAAEALCLTKGAVSYQIRQLEEELGFSVFIRQPGRIILSDKGKRLWPVAQNAFQHMEQEITGLREDDNTRITIGTTTYFASRWLSPRLMTFISGHPQVSLRIQPMLDLTNLRADNIDMAIRWGKGEWNDAQIEPLFKCPAMVTAGVKAAQYLAEQGIDAIQHLWLLHDREDSDAWEDWFRAAGLVYRPRRDELVIPDPNVRVQAVIDGQGIALNDSLVASELAGGVLQQVSDVQLDEYGYFLAYAPEALNNPVLCEFREWLFQEV